MAIGGGRAGADSVMWERGLYGDVAGYISVAAGAAILGFALTASPFCRTPEYRPSKKEPKGLLSAAWMPSCPYATPALGRLGRGLKIKIQSQARVARFS